MFMGVLRGNRFEVRLDFGDGVDHWTWKDICKYEPSVAGQFQSYKLQVVEVEGDLNAIVDLFVRINSTGKRLTGAEKRNAKFYTSPFLKEAARLVSKSKPYLLQQKILSQAQLDRMKGVELFSELLMSIKEGGPINKKTALDRAIGNEVVNGKTLQRVSGEFTKTIGIFKKLFPELRQTRFRNTAEFYTLFLLIWEMSNHKFILGDKRRSAVALGMLRELSTGVDLLRERLRKAETGKPPHRLFQDYLLTVQGDTDSIANRERRRKILKDILWSLFERQDEKRLFTETQRRILWNTDFAKLCGKCSKPVSWNELSVDHIKAYSKGGATSLANAQLMHKRCNSSKGSKSAG